jgi:tetratricopeptide (TPR) repeat protein
MEINEYYDEITRLWPQPGQLPSKSLLDICFHSVDEYPDIQPDSSDLWYSLGIIMSRCDDSYEYSAKDYLRCFENAIKYDPTNAEAYQELGYVLDVYFDKYEEAEEAFKKAIEFGAGHESYYGLARVLAQMCKEDDALYCISEENCPYSEHPEINKLRTEIKDRDWFWSPPE